MRLCLESPPKTNGLHLWEMTGSGWWCRKGKGAAFPCVGVDEGRPLAGAASAGSAFLPQEW